MAQKVVWTKRANNKFNKIIDYLDQKWGSTTTENFVKKTYDIIELIADHPELGTLEIQDKNIRGILLTKHNRLFYRIEKETIILLIFFDTRSDLKKF